jgi:hypothetical protein
MNTANDFFDNLVRWQSWCAEMIPFAEEWIKESKTRPGMRFDYNLFLYDGSVWGFGSNGSWVRMTRQGQERWERTKEVRQDIPREKLVRCQKEDDWAWYVAAEEPRYWEPKFDELSYWESSKRRALRGAAFADTLLNQRTAIEAWAEEFGRSMDRSDLRSVDGDFQALVEKFCPLIDAKDPNIPDHGSILCSLHMWLDKISGHTHRTYCY